MWRVVARCHHGRPIATHWGMARMNKRDFAKQVMAANLGVLVQWKPVTGEWRLAYLDDSPYDCDGRVYSLGSEREANAYYSDDADDVAATAKAMWDARYLVKRS